MFHKYSNSHRTFFKTLIGPKIPTEKFWFSFFLSWSNKIQHYTVDKTYEIYFLCNTVLLYEINHLYCQNVLSNMKKIF